MEGLVFVVVAYTWIFTLGMIAAAGWFLWDWFIVPWWKQRQERRRILRSIGRTARTHSLMRSR